MGEEWEETPRRFCQGLILLKLLGGPHLINSMDASGQYHRGLVVKKNIQSHDVDSLLALS